MDQGRSIIAATEAKLDRGVADTMFANRLNKLIREGKLTRKEVEELIKGNDNLAIEEVSVTVTEAEPPDKVRLEPTVLGPFVASEANLESNNRKRGDGECAQMPQVDLEAQGIGLGFRIL